MSLRLPAWVYELVANLQAEEEVHPKLFMQRYDGAWLQWDWCPAVALALVPDDVKANAAVIAAYTAEKQPPTEAPA